MISYVNLVFAIFITVLFLMIFALVYCHEDAPQQPAQSLRGDDQKLEGKKELPAHAMGVRRFKKPLEEKLATIQATRDDLQTQYLKPTAEKPKALVNAFLCHVVSTLYERFDILVQAKEKYMRADGPQDCDEKRSPGQEEDWQNLKGKIDVLHYQHNALMTYLGTLQTKGVQWHEDLLKQESKLCQHICKQSYNHKTLSDYQQMLAFEPERVSCAHIEDAQRCLSILQQYNRPTS